jgi:hypothetical protein
MDNKVSSDWLPSYIKATRTVLEIFKMAGYFPYSPHRNCKYLVFVNSDMAFWVSMIEPCGLLHFQNQLWKCILYNCNVGTGIVDNIIFNFSISWKRKIFLMKNTPEEKHAQFSKAW